MIPVTRRVISRSGEDESSRALSLKEEKWCWGWDWAREWGREGVAPNGGELMDLESGGELKVGLVGLEGARERLGVRELPGDVTDCKNRRVGLSKGARKG